MAVHRSRRLITATALAVTMLAAGCGYGPNSAESVPEPDTAVLDNGAGLVAATVAVPTGFDPHRERTSGERVYYYPVFDRLTRVETGGVVVPMLATSWDTAPDAMSMRMSLREGVVFHDGTPFDSRALVESVTSRTLLGRERVMTERAGTDPTSKRALEFTEDSVEGQSCPVAFGSVSRRVVMKRWAAVTRVAWWCQPSQERPSKWSSPRPVFNSR